MTSNEERREIARKLRDIKCVDLGDGLVCPSCDLGEALDFDWANDNYIFEDTVDKLAELIDRPTCRKLIPDEMEGLVFCSNCGAEIGEYGVPNYCHNCGAEVIE